VAMHPIACETARLKWSLRRKQKQNLVAAPRAELRPLTGQVCGKHRAVELQPELHPGLVIGSGKQAARAVQGSLSWGQTNACQGTKVAQLPWLGKNDPVLRSEET